ncbi:ABC transporter permease [Nocardioides mangrovi]|uniref:ABC transporter permease n=1 Tax=Nocardioides mangrovi TaxID=2874580 RepID=A0ABS7U975_9ACTN|nr:ABC transporter permease [Nocardioides mangrovi]MBZ5737422.1 ABC transporter permease [Nocardioides mangrovi]
MTLDLGSTAPTPFSRLVRVELRKSWDTRAGFWLIASIALIVAAAEIIVLAVVVSQDESVALGDFVGTAAFLTSILLPVLGIMVVTTEWSQRTAMVTFALEPRRPHVIAAKALVGVALTLVTVVVSIAVGALCNALYGILQGGADWTFGWDDFSAFLVTQVLAMLGGFALAALLLNTPAAIVFFFVYKWVLPGLFEIGAQLIGWFSDLRPWLDFQSAQEAVWEWSSSGKDWAELVVSGILWLVVPLTFGIWRILRAEVK